MYLLPLTENSTSEKFCFVQLYYCVYIMRQLIRLLILIRSIFLIVNFAKLSVAFDFVIIQFDFDL